MKLSDFKDEEALEVLADLIEPATEIFNDEEVQNLYKTNALVARIAAVALKRHKTAVMSMLAAMHRQTVEEYHCNIASVLVDLITMLNDKELMSFFRQQGQTMADTSSGSAMENTEDGGQ